MMDIKIKHSKESVSVYVDDQVFMTINRSILNQIANPPKKVKPKSSLENKTSILINEYKKAWESFYNVKLRTEHKKGTKSYADFVKAAELCVQHGVKAKVFIASQVEGLRFVNGQGIFPKPNQLCTPAAETRLIEFIKDASIESKPILSAWEIDTPLEKNQRYQQIRLKIKDGSATLKEAKYAMECELKRTNQTRIETRAYVKVMEENAR